MPTRIEFDRCEVKKMGEMLERKKEVQNYKIESLLNLFKCTHKLNAHIW